MDQAVKDMTNGEANGEESRPGEESRKHETVSKVIKEKREQRGNEAQTQTRQPVHLEDKIPGRKVTPSFLAKSIF